MRTALVLLAIVAMCSGENYMLQFIKLLYKVDMNQAKRLHMEVSKGMSSPEPFSYYEFPSLPSSAEPEGSTEPSATGPTSEPKPENPWPELVNWALAEAEAESEAEAKAEAAAEEPATEPESDPEEVYKNLAWFFLAVVFMAMAVALSIALAVTCTKLKAQTKM